jgi:hypothetical protein
MDLAMVVLHLHSENGAALVQLLHFESDQDAEFAQFHTALSELEVLFSQFAFACFAQNTSFCRVSDNANDPSRAMSRISARCV